jgi:cytochrome P450
LEDSEIINEMTNLIFAGTDTTSNTFSYMFYELARLPEWQDRLQKELDSIQFVDVPEYTHIMKLPVLNAIVDETLRFHPSAPSSLQRVAQGTATIVDGINIPSDVSDQI